MHAETTLQIVAGRLDLLVDLEDGYALFDHKSFPDTVGVDQNRLRQIAGQLSLYAQAIEQVTGKTRLEYWIHQSSPA